MARTHEETGLWEPSDRAAQIGAVDGKSLDLFPCDPPYPAGCVHGLTLGRHHIRILKSCQTRLTFRKFSDLSEWHPGEIPARTAARDRGEKESYNRHG